MVRTGTVHALLGENGAGKTTLMRIVDGLVAADSGEMRRSGAPYLPRNPRAARAARVAMVHQHYALVDALTVAENVALGGHGSFAPRDAAARVAQLAAQSGLAVDPWDRVASLDISARQRVEILKAIDGHADLLILDEPTAVLAPRESAELLAWVRAFATSGRSVVFITHKLDDALAIADDVTVLRHGRVALSTSAHSTSAGALARAMLGDQAVHRARGPAPVRVPGDISVRAVELAVPDHNGTLRIRGASFLLRTGELVGVAGVEGAGQRELLRALAGRLRPARGTLTVPPAAGFIPEDRLRDALVPEMSLADNVSLRGASARRGLLDSPSALDRARHLLVQHDIRAAGPRAAAESLSGGNQQRFVIAREMDPRPALLVAEHPTRGLDIRASEDVRERLISCAGQGTTVVFHSNDLDEIVALADRVLVVHHGHVTEVAVEPRAIGRAMIGA